MLLVRRNDWLLSIGWLLALILWGLSGYDEAITVYFFEVTTSSFPYIHHWFWEDVMHDGVHDMVVVLALLSLAGVFYYKGEKRRAFIFIFASMVVSTTVVAAIKYKSQVGCPWDMAEYGGDTPAGMGSRCWPSGHASVGFCLLAFYFAARWLQLSLTNLILAVVVVIGLALSFSQTVRGAHFLSHGLWSGLVIWCVNAVMSRLLLVETALDGSAASSAYSDQREVLAGSAVPARVPVGNSEARDEFKLKSS